MDGEEEEFRESLKEQTLANLLDESIALDKWLHVIKKRIGLLRVVCPLLPAVILGLHTLFDFGVWVPLLLVPFLFGASFYSSPVLKPSCKREITHYVVIIEVWVTLVGGLILEDMFSSIMQLVVFVCAVVVGAIAGFLFERVIKAKLARYEKKLNLLNEEILRRFRRPEQE